MKTMILLTDQNSIRRKYIYQYLGSIPKSAYSLVVIFYYFFNTSQAARRPYDYSKMKSLYSSTKSLCCTGVCFGDENWLFEKYWR